MQPMKKGKFVEYKVSASDSQVGPINLKLLPAILEGMGILKSIWMWSCSYQYFFKTMPEFESF